MLRKYWKIFGKLPENTEEIFRKLMENFEGEILGNFVQILGKTSKVFIKIFLAFLGNTEENFGKCIDILGKI